MGKGLKTRPLLLALAACFSGPAPAAAEPTIQETQMAHLKSARDNWDRWSAATKSPSAGKWIKFTLKDPAISAEARSQAWAPLDLLLAAGSDPEATESVPLLILDPRPTATREDQQAIMVRFERNKLSPYYFTNIPQSLLLALRPPEPKVEESASRMPRCNSTINCHGGGASRSADYPPLKLDFSRPGLPEFIFKPVNTDMADRMALLDFIGRQDAMAELRFSRRDLECPSDFPLEAINYQTDWLMASYPTLLEPMDSLSVSQGRLRLRIEVKAPTELDKPLDRAELNIETGQTTPLETGPLICKPIRGKRD